MNVVTEFWNFWEYEAMVMGVVGDFVWGFVVVVWLVF